MLLLLLPPPLHPLPPSSSRYPKQSSTSVPEVKEKEQHAPPAFRGLPPEVVKRLARREDTSHYYVIAVEVSMDRGLH